MATTIHYTDFDISFDTHPVSGDILLKTDRNAIKNSVKNLVLTQLNERPFEPSFGTRVLALLFAMMDDANIMEYEIRKFLEINEPRIYNVSVEIKPTQSQRQVEIRIVYTIRNLNNLQDSVSLNITSTGVS